LEGVAKCKSATRTSYPAPGTSDLHRFLHDIPKIIALHRRIIKEILPLLALSHTMSSIEYCITPEQATRIDVMQPCPPPPRAAPKVFDILVLSRELCSDAPLGFFLAAPSNSSTATDRRIQFKNNHIKLLPKKSGYHFEDAYRGLSARSA